MIWGEPLAADSITPSETVVSSSLLPDCAGLDVTSMIELRCLVEDMESDVLQSADATRTDRATQFGR